MCDPHLWELPLDKLTEALDALESKSKEGQRVIFKATPETPNSWGKILTNLGCVRPPPPNYSLSALL